MELEGGLGGESGWLLGILPLALFHSKILGVVDSILAITRFWGFLDSGRLQGIVYSTCDAVHNSVVFLTAKCLCGMCDWTLLDFDLMDVNQCVG